MSTNTLLDKNIIIHGAGLVKPTSLNHLNDSQSTSSANDNIKPTINSAATAANSAFLPLNNSNGHPIFLSNSNQHGINNRSANSSTQAYHHQINEDNSYENDYSDFNYNTYNTHSLGENNNNNNGNGNNVNTNESIDEINLLNPNNSINFNRNSYYYNSHNINNNAHFNYGHFNNSINNRNHSTNYQPLPPIENSLTFKVKK